MRLFQPTKTLTMLLVVLLSIPQPLFAQVPRRPVQPKKPLRSDLIAAAISDLLKELPLASSDEDAEEALDEKSSDELKPPADNAPIQELVEFWGGYNFSEYDDGAPKPSDKVRERLLEFVENRPWMSGRLLERLPKTSDAYDRLYKLLNENADDGARQDWQHMVRLRLMYNSSYFREELISQARASINTSYVDKSALMALVKLDWDTAKPLIEEMSANPSPNNSVRAMAMIYEQASKGGDASQVEALRSQLKAIVANRLMAGERHTALSSLMETEWSGRDEWYASLFADASLSGVQTEEKIAAEKPKAGEKTPPPKAVQPMYEGDLDSNVLWVPLLADAEKFLPVVIGLVGNGNRTVHLAAVSTLTAYLANSAGKEEQRKQAARALVPWLSQPDWGGALERWSYLQSLAGVNVPESVPGLIWILDNDDQAENRAIAADALIQHKNPQAIPALRRALARGGDEYLRESIISALAQLGGIPDAEAAAAIEAYARFVMTEKGAVELSDARSGESEIKLPLPVSMGAIYAESESLDISDGLATLLFNRAKALRKTQPDVARKLISVAEQSEGIVADLEFIEQIGEGWVDVESLKLGLENRAQLRKRTTDKLEELFKQGGYQTGLAAVILKEEDKLKNVLTGRDALAQQALLAAARYTREKLPVELVGKLMANASLALSAESYLEVEDSPEARKLVWARHPGEAKILGERRMGDVSAPPPNGRFDGPPTLNKWEDKMRDEIQRPNGPTEIYAVAASYNPGINNTIIVRVSNGKAEINLYQAEGRRSFRTLDSGELQELKDLTSREEIENLGPDTTIGISRGYHERGPLQYEYLRLTKDGGRRIMLSWLHREPKLGATLHEQLGGLFYRLSKTGEYKLRYTMEDLIPGVEVLLADDKRQVLSICQEAGQFRVMVTAERANPTPRNVPNLTPDKMYEWRALASGQLGAPVDDPPNCQSSNMFLSTPDWLKELLPKIGAMPDRRAKVGETWFTQANIENESGIWKLEEGKAPVKIVEGYYIGVVAAPDGKWLVALKSIESNDNYETKIVRINLETKREYPLSGAQTANLIPVAYVAAHNQVLLIKQEFQYREDSKGEFFLLNPDTGAIVHARGELRPLLNQYARPLQPTDKPNEFWAAMYDAKKKATAIGRYDARTFTFTPVVELPEIRLNSADTWADAATGKLYFVYLGHLLRVPLAK